MHMHESDNPIYAMCIHMCICHMDIWTALCSPLPATRNAPRPHSRTAPIPHPHPTLRPKVSRHATCIQQSECSSMYASMTYRHSTSSKSTMCYSECILAFSDSSRFAIVKISSGLCYIYLYLYLYYKLLLVVGLPVEVGTLYYTILVSYWCMNDVLQ